MRGGHVASQRTTAFGSEADIVQLKQAGSVTPIETDR